MLHIHSQKEMYQKLLNTSILSPRKIVVMSTIIYSVNTKFQILMSFRDIKYIWDIKEFKIGIKTHN